MADAIQIANDEIDMTVERLKRAFIRTKRDLLTAHKIIEPLSYVGATSGALPNASTSGVSSPNSLVRKTCAEASVLAVKGVALGTSAMIFVWQGAQVVGVASTGTAILGLHGAAASNAGWALFGGGSLATGGGGMALGHLVLPGVGLAIAIGYGAVITHKKANELNRACEEIEAANHESEAALAKVDAGLSKLRQSERSYGSADEQLRAALKVARRRLRRFGIFSVLFRFVRFKWNGIYYSAQEKAWAEELDRKVNDFFSAVGFERV